MNKLTAAFNQYRTTRKVKNLIAAAEKNDVQKMDDILAGGLDTSRESGYKNDRSIGTFGSRDYLASALYAATMAGKKSSAEYLTGKIVETYLPEDLSSERFFHHFADLSRQRATHVAKETYLDVLAELEAKTPPDLRTDVLELALKESYSELFFRPPGRRKEALPDAGTLQEIAQHFEATDTSMQKIARSHSFSKRPANM